MAGVMRFELFRRHVPCCADRTAFFGEFGHAAQFRQSEIHDLHDAILTDHDVFRLNIPMDNPFFMRHSQTVRDLNSIFNRLFQTQ